MNELVALLLNHGPLIVFVATLAARIGAPVPAAPLLVVAGSLVAAGQMSIAAALATSIVANVLGDGLWFLAGRRYGYRVMKQLCRISLSPDSCVRQSESLITDWGGSSLIAAKFVPGVSVIAAPMAGALGMSTARFLAFEVVAGLAWTIAFMALGMLFSDEIQRIFELMTSTGKIATAAVVAAIGALIALRYWKRRRFLRQLEMPRIGIDELHALIEQGRDPIVIDVRSDAGTQLDARRIPGAVSIHLSEIGARAAELARDREIVVYCNCPNEVSAAQAAATLVAQGLVRVRPLAGGLDAWIAAGRATEPISADASLPHEERQAAG